MVQCQSLRVVVVVMRRMRGVVALQGAALHGQVGQLEEDEHGSDFEEGDIVDGLGANEMHENAFI